MAGTGVLPNPWFKNIFGFDEDTGNFNANKAKFKMTGNTLVCDTAPDKFKNQNVGLFECLSLSELHEKITNTTKAVASSLANIGTLTFEHIAVPEGVQALHIIKGNNGAVFQVASQFNCLEMANRSITPSAGITIYIDDPTQGPACAMACPAGTVYRNYFVKHGTNEGQKNEQINNLAGVEAVLNNAGLKYWNMENGYVIPARHDSINELKTYIETLDQDKVKDVENALRVGIHWSTSVTPPNTYNVCQVYASAVPCTYPSGQKLPEHMPATLNIWEPFARLVLRATYEATLAVATVQSLQLKKRIRCYLTLLGGGVFGNDYEWIRDAINLALTNFSEYPLDVKLVHPGTKIDKYWSTNLPERQDTRVLTLPPASGLPPPTDEAAAAAASTKAAKDKAAKDKAAAASGTKPKTKPKAGTAATTGTADPKTGTIAAASGTKVAAGTAKPDPTGATTKALEPIVPLNINRMPTTLLLLGTSLVRSLLSIQATSKIVPKELQVSDLLEFNSNLSNLPSLKNKETKNKLGDIDKIIDNNISKSDELQVKLAKYNIGITGNSIYIDTQKSSKELSIVKEEDLFKLLAKINKLPIFQNPEEVKKILLKIDREDSSNVKKMLKEYFNIAISESRVSIDLT
jgi:hypothetical protein